LTKPSVFEPEPGKLAPISKRRNIAALHSTSCEIHAPLDLSCPC
jgi:hypothetical protein